MAAEKEQKQIAPEVLDGKRKITSSTPAHNTPTMGDMAEIPENIKGKADAMMADRGAAKNALPVEGAGDANQRTPDSRDAEAMKQLKQAKRDADLAAKPYPRQDVDKG